jgi:hypothetical protein
MTKEGSSSSSIVVEGACLAFLTRVDTRHDSHSLSVLFRLFIATHKSTNGLEDLFLLVSFHQISLTPPLMLLSSPMFVHSSIITAEKQKTIKRIFYYCSCLFYERPQNPIISSVMALLHARRRRAHDKINHTMCEPEPVVSGKHNRRRAHKFTLVCLILTHSDVTQAICRVQQLMNSLLPPGALASQMCDKCQMQCTSCVCILK